MTRVVLVLDHAENQRLLAEELAPNHEVVAAESGAELDADIDLLVLDGRALDRLWERIEARKAAERPVFLPVLLVTSRPGVKMVTRHLWRSVDELIITPIEKAELQARIHILLRARSLSLRLKERAEDAEQATRTRDEVLAMVSHDLRNPLDVVLSSGSFLLETAKGLETRQRDLLQRVHRSANQMSRLIRDLLDVGVLESGNVNVEPEPVPVEPLVRGACRQREHAAQAEGIELRAEVEEGLPRVRADHDRIDQVLGNLVGNALKFTPAGGAVVVRAEADEAGVLFSVADTGPGIPEGDREHVFDRFWQARRSRRSGTGLGLAIARGIVEAHGGRMWMESEVGRGSTFFFTLPAADPDPGMRRPGPRNGTGTGPA